jgi:hypothetical protein
MSDTTETPGPSPAPAPAPTPDKRERRRERRRKAVETIRGIVDLLTTVAAAVRYVQQTRGR